MISVLNGTVKYLKSLLIDFGLCDCLNLKIIFIGMYISEPFLELFCMFYKLWWDWIVQIVIEVIKKNSLKCILSTFKLLFLIFISSKNGHKGFKMWIINKQLLNRM